MTEDLIAVEKIKTIEPTAYIELDSDLRNYLKTHDESLAHNEMFIMGLYMAPNDKINIYPGKHTIAVASYSQETAKTGISVMEHLETLYFEDGTRDIVTDLIEKEKRTIEQVYSKDTDEFEVEKHHLVHEETHQTQAVRMGVALTANKLLEISKQLVDNGSNNDPAFKEANARLSDLLTWSETQAFQQSLISKSLKYENKKLYTVLALSDVAVQFALMENGKSVGQYIYEGLSEGKPVDPHILAILILVDGNTQLPQMIASGELHYPDLKTQMLEKVKTLTNRPEEILEQISSMRFTKDIESHLQHSVLKANQFLEDQKHQS